MSNDTVKAPPLIGFRFNGRYGRLNFLNAISIIYLYAFFLDITYKLIGYTVSNGYDLLGAEVFLVIFLVPSTIIFFRASVLRLHDFNRSYLIAAMIIITTGLLVLAKITAIIIVIFAVILSVASGNKQENRYGLPSIQGKNYGLIIIVLIQSYWSFLFMQTINEAFKNGL
ncbi:DUF805 domain-containing protein [Neisseria sp. Ec49-e6-T10]|uniref:DUF805 domain-containing protein n=1 Tax=Neisseria sp. Ec49-e6-T10 TaxID=3140744 RepID=UPI003EBF1CC8